MSDARKPAAHPPRDHDASEPVPSWIVGVCGVAAVASALFSILMFLNR